MVCGDKCRSLNVLAIGEGEMKNEKVVNAYHGGAFIFIGCM